LYCTDGQRQQASEKTPTGDGSSQVYICISLLQSKGIGYSKDGNCFPWIEDIDAGQDLLNKPLETNWSDVLMRIETTINSTRDFKVYRYPDDNLNRPASWQNMPAEPPGASSC
jgi:hypothetical protein